jgi:hypothetical protein
MTSLKKIWFSYEGLSLFSGVLPDLDSLTKLKEFSVKAEGLIGVFPDIRNMPDFEWCLVLPSKLCLNPEIDLSVYTALGEECDASSLPVCSAQDLTDIAAAQAEEAIIQTEYYASDSAAPVTTAVPIAEPTSESTADPIAETTAAESTAKPTAEPTKASAAPPSFAVPGVLTTVLLLVLTLL